MSKPDPSEWGKLSGGQEYRMIALDLGDALSMVDMGVYPSRVFWHVQKESWASIKTKGRLGRDVWPEPLPVQLPARQLAKQWDVPYQRVQEAKSLLLARRMIVESDGGFWINKNADEWVNPATGAPLLRPVDLANCLASRTRRQPSNPDEDAATDLDGCDTSCRVVDESSGHGKPCHPVTANRVTLTRSTVTPPSYMAPARLDLEIKEDSFTPLTPQGGDAIKTPDLGSQRPLKFDQREFERISMWAEDVFPDSHDGTHVSTWIKSQAPTFALDWIEDALKIAASNGKQSRWRSYAHKIMVNWEMAGGKNAADVRAADLRLNPRRDRKGRPLTIEQAEADRAERIKRNRELFKDV